MNANIVAGLQNTCGRFAQYYNLNQGDLLPDLFSTKKTVHLRIPDKKIEAVGHENVSKALKALIEEREKKGVLRDIHIYHSPAYKVSEDEKTGLAVLDTYSYEVIETPEGKKTEYYYTRLDCKLVKEKGLWKLIDLDWWEVMSFVPWDYSEARDEGLQVDVKQLPVPPAPAGKLTGKDFYEIQNVLTRFVQNNRRYAIEDTFAQSGDISMNIPVVFSEPKCGRDAVGKALAEMEAMEKTNLGKYVFVPAVSSPVIEVSADRRTAQGQWLALMHMVKGEAFGIQQAPYDYIRRVGLVRCDFVKERGAWRMKSFDMDILLTLPYLVYDPDSDMGRRYQRMGMNENNWRPAPPKMGGVYPDDMAEIELMMPMWVSAYRRGVYPEHLKKHCFNDEYETVFTSRLMGRNAPPIVGTDAMMERFTMATFEYHHQQPSYHTGMCPVIDISADGKYGTVQYFDLNTTPYIPQRTDKDNTPYAIKRGWSADDAGIEHVPCYTQLCKYEHHFAKVRGEWKHIKIDFEAILTLQDFETRGRASRGWAGAVSDFKYPALFEPYEYVSERKVK